MPSRSGRVGTALLILFLSMGTGYGRGDAQDSGEDGIREGWGRTSRLLGAGEAARLGRDLAARLRFFTTPQEETAAPFSWSARRIGPCPGGAVWEVAMPSPLATAEKAFATIRVRWYEPTSGRLEGRAPAIVVLHHLGGGFEVEEALCARLAFEGVHAVFFWLPGYGPRRPPGFDRSRFMREPRRLVGIARRAVIDLRRVADWLVSLPTVHPDRLGLAGVSLGAVVGGLAAGVDPRFRKNTLILGGGDLARIILEGTETRETAERLRRMGVGREELERLLEPIEPLRFASRVDAFGTLLLNAERDEVIPRACTEALWRAMGRPRIRWYPAGHYSMAAHLLDLFDRVVRNARSEWF